MALPKILELLLAASLLETSVIKILTFWGMHKLYPADGVHVGPALVDTKFESAVAKLLTKQI